MFRRRIGVHLPAWIRSYLLVRLHYNTSDNQTSKPNIASEGLDAGRILSGFLFLIYTTEVTLIIDDLNNQVGIDETFLYVDDMWTYISGSSMIYLKHKIDDFSSNVNNGKISTPFTSPKTKYIF